MSSSTEQAESWPAVDGTDREHRRGNGFATAALVLGVTGVTLVTVVPGLVFGILGLRRAASCGAGRVRSWLGIGLCLFWAAAASYLLPHLVRAADPGCAAYKGPALTAFNRVISDFSGNHVAPGMGTSSFQPGRRLTDWADDVRQLADSLEIQRFLVAGFSGGGPHALAVAHGLPDRVIAAGSIAGAGPIGTRDARKALKHANPINRLIFALARKAPGLLWPLLAHHASAIRRHPGKVIDSAARDRSLPESDRQAMTDPGLRERMMAAAPEAFRQGVRGAVHEAHVCARPWGFDPAAIKPPVYLWHGGKDTNVPVAMAQDLAERIPDSSLTVYPGEGHLIVPKHWDEILATLLSAAPRATTVSP